MRFNNTQPYRFTITFQLYKLFIEHIIIRINIILLYPVRTMSQSSSSAVWDSAGRGVIDLVEPFSTHATCTYTIICFWYIIIYYTYT